MTRRTLTAALAALALLGGIGTAQSAEKAPTGRTATVGPHNGDRATIYGCTAEDSCAINYHGGGVWTIRRDKH